jgi:aspartate-semialdehyde dehydrogenase
MKRLRAALAGATGAVGQRYVTMLRDHPFIRLEVLMGNESAGKSYGEAVRWLDSTQLDERYASAEVSPTSPRSADGCDIVFSALPSVAAEKAEKEFAKAGFTVISEASAHRMEPDVPLIVPEVNHEHLGLIERQRKRRGWKGAIVATPNCTVTGLVLALKPLTDRYALKKCVVTTMQAVSGAGYPGVPSLDVIENVIPYIKDEEEKVSSESGKILGLFSSGSVSRARIQLAVSCNRVPVLEGHTESFYGEFGSPVDPAEAEEAMASFVSLPQRLCLPTAPERPIVVRRERDRPQPRLDRMAGSVPGMSVVVGRVRRGIGPRSLQFTLLSHNTVRGAAGNAILTAELMRSRGVL